MTPPRPPPPSPGARRGAAQGERGPAPPPRPRLARGGRSDRCRRRSRPRGMTWGGSGSRLPREIWGLRRPAERCAGVSSRGRGTGGRGGRPAGPGARGLGARAETGDAGPPRGGGRGVSDRDPPGRWDEPGGEQGRRHVPRERVSPPLSLHSRGAPGTVISAGRAGETSRTGSLSAVSDRFSVRELVFLLQKLSLGCLLISPSIAARSFVQPAASNLCGFHSTSRTVSHKSQRRGGGGSRDSPIFLPLFLRTPPSQVEGCPQGGCSGKLVLPGRTPEGGRCSEGRLPSS